MNDTVLGTLRAVRREVSNWVRVSAVVWPVVPSRCPPRKGIPSLATRLIDVVMRDGTRVSCRINEAFNVFEVFCFGAYDSPAFDWSRVRGVVDVGANVGAASIWFARRAPDATIIAIEPAEETAVRLRENLARNGLAGRVHVVQVALGGQRGHGGLRSGYSSALASLTDAANATEVVAVETLEEVLDRFPGFLVDVFKIDCEGAEYDILLGARDDVLRRAKLIVGEYHGHDLHRPDQLSDRLSAAGFDVQLRPTGERDGHGEGLIAARRRT